jgi:GAF domain-containing protein
MESPSTIRAAEPQPTLRAERLATLVQVSRMLTSELDPAEIVHQVLQNAIAHIPAADAGTLYLWDPDDDKLRASVTIGFGASIFNLALDVGEGAAGRAFHFGHGEIHPSEEAIAETLRTASAETLRHFRSASQGVRTPRAAMSAALVFKSKPLGAIVVDAIQDGPAFGPDDLEFIEDFARIAAVAIANARLYESERATRVRLEVLNAEITRQRDELDRRARSLDAMIETGRGRPDLATVARRLASLTTSRVYILDGIARMRHVHPSDAGGDAGEDAGPSRMRTDAAFEQLVELVGRDRQRHSSVTDDAGHLVGSPVTAGPEQLGYVVIDTFERRPDAVDEALVDSAALIVSTVFMLERALEEGDVRRRSDLLRRLLDGDPPKSASATRALQPPLLLAVGRVVPTRPSQPAKIDPNLTRALRTATSNAVRGMLPSGVVDIRDDHVVIACSPADAALTARLVAELEDVVARFAPETRDWSARFAVSELVSDLAVLPQVHREVHLALKIRPKADRPVIQVSGLGAYRLIIGAAKANDVSDFSRRTFARVLKHDGSLDGKILSTFRTYLAAGASVTAAANELGVHPHTVQYRLNRLEELTGLRLRDSEERLTLELAFRILDLQGA